MPAPATSVTTACGCIGAADLGAVKMPTIEAPEPEPVDASCIPLCSGEREREREVARRRRDMVARIARSGLFGLRGMMSSGRGRGVNICSASAIASSQKIAVSSFPIQNRHPGTFSRHFAPAMTAPLRRLARVAHVPRAVHRVPFAVRGKATAYVARSAGTLSSRGEYTQNRQIDDTTSHHLLPFYATMVGRVLSTALSETQRLAFAGRFLSSPGTSRRAVSQTEHTTDAAITAARKERDAAVSRANLNEANALTLRLRLAQSDHAAVETLRGELKDAQAEAADMRIALNALKFARQDTRVVETRSDWSSVLEISPRESELKTAIAALSAELDDAKQRVLNAEAASANFASSLVMDVRTKNRELTNAANADAAFSQTERHPIFGHLLKDFGFKKVFAMKAGVLADKKLVKVYEQQRAFRSARAVTIAEMKTEDRFAVPGVISLAEGTAAVKTSGPAGATKSAFSEIFAAPTRSVSILDGQHRVGALAILLEKGVIRDTDEVLVEVFPNVCDTKASDLFTEINQR